ncbi:MAG: DNA repair protein RecN, partial [candidate division Zixibacteria bacterium]
MLSLIKIENFALIEKLEVEFGAELNILTGSTGSGKSIIISALELALGAKGSEEMIRSGESAAVVEASFEIDGDDDIVRITSQNNIPFEKNLTIRREYRRKGGSRAFVNRKPVSLGTLRNFSEKLVSILGQHSHQALLNPSTHLGFLDDFAVPMEKLSKLKELYNKAVDLGDRISYAKRHARETAERIDLISFQINEIEKADIKLDEEEKLKNEKNILENVLRLKEVGEMACLTLLESDDSALGSIGEVTKALREIPGPEIKNIVGMIKSASDSLNETVRAIRNLVDRVEDDPVRLEEINGRLYEIARLKKKHGGSVDAVINYLVSSKKELKALRSRSGDNRDLSAEFEKTRESLNRKASQISQLRYRAKDELTELVVRRLLKMGMPKARVAIDIKTMEDVNGLYEVNGKRFRGDSSGFETVEFQFSANPGEDLKPLAKIASGGEISRVMLALKNAFRGDTGGGCEIFDEIDAGISGDVAAKIASQLKELSEKHQVICITHLHQIASAADHHYKVFKEKSGRRTITGITKLDHEGRVKEIAALLSGEKVTAKAMEGARE